MSKKRCSLKCSCQGWHYAEIEFQFESTRDSNNKNKCRVYQFFISLHQQQGEMTFSLLILLRQSARSLLWDTLITKQLQWMAYLLINNDDYGHTYSHTNAEMILNVIAAKFTILLLHIGLQLLQLSSFLPLFNARKKSLQNTK